MGLTAQSVPTASEFIFRNFYNILISLVLPCHVASFIFMATPTQPLTEISVKNVGAGTAAQVESPARLSARHYGLSLAADRLYPEDKTAWFET